MSKIRNIPVFNCNLVDGTSHGVTVHYSESYKPLGIGNSTRPTKEDNQLCMHKPEGGNVNFSFSIDGNITEDFAGIRIICSELNCPFNNKERK